MMVRLQKLVKTKTNYGTKYNLSESNTMSTIPSVPDIGSNGGNTTTISSSMSPEDACEPYHDHTYESIYDEYNDDVIKLAETLDKVSLRPWIKQATKYTWHHDVYVFPKWPQGKVFSSTDFGSAMKHEYIRKVCGKRVTFNHYVNLEKHNCDVDDIFDCGMKMNSKKKKKGKKRNAISKKIKRSRST